MYDVTLTVCIISYAVYIASTLYEIKALYLWHNFHCIYNVIPSIHDITFIVHDLTSMYMWHHSHCIYDITSNIFMTSHAPYMTWHPLWLCHHIDYLWHHMTKQPLCLWIYTHHIYGHMHCIDDITTSAFITSHALYTTSHPLFYDIIPSTFHIHYICDITCTISMIKPIVSMTSHQLYRTSNPLYMTSHPLYICDFTPTVFMTS